MLSKGLVDQDAGELEDKGSNREAHGHGHIEIRPFILHLSVNLQSHVGSFKSKSTDSEKIWNSL
jgi:hypothetical protein